MSERVPLGEVNAIVLVGGLSTRMCNTTPKPLLPLTEDQKIIDYPLDLLDAAGIRNIVLSCVRSTVDQIGKYVQTGRDHRLGYTPKLSVKDEPQGVIPAIAQPIEEFNLRGKPIIILHGDEVLFADLAQMYGQHIYGNHPTTTCVSGDPNSENKVFAKFNGDYQIQDVTRFDKDRTVKEAAEKGWTHTLTGLWIINPEQIHRLVTSQDADQFIFDSRVAGVLYGYPNQGSFMNINTKRQLEDARRLLAS